MESPFLLPVARLLQGRNMSDTPAIEAGVFMFATCFVQAVAAMPGPCSHERHSRLYCCACSMQHR